MSAINERYYGVRVGDPRRHLTYLAVGNEHVVPALFVTKHDAQRFALKLPKQSTAKVVRVRITAR